MIINPVEDHKIEVSGNLIGQPTSHVTPPPPPPFLFINIHEESGCKRGFSLIGEWMCSYMFIIMSLTVSNLLRSAMFTLEKVTTRRTHCNLLRWDVTHGLGILPQQAEIVLKTQGQQTIWNLGGRFILIKKKNVHSISSDFSDLPDMTAVYIL